MLKTDEEIELLKPHRHDGRDYPAGSTLRLPTGKAQWLIGLKVARQPGAAQADAKKTTTKE